jgi:hypothetical protein
MDTPRIAALGKGGNELFINVKIAVWDQYSDVHGTPPSLVSLVLDDVKLSTKNINQTELSHSLGDAARCSEVGHCRKYQTYSIPVPSALQREAARQLKDVDPFELKNFNALADNLKASSDRVRLAGLLNLYKLAKSIGSLRSPAIQQLIPLLRDEVGNVRAAAAVALQSLGATEAIPAIRQALAETSDEDIKNIIKKSLDRLQR